MFICLNSPIQCSFNVLKSHFYLYFGSFYPSYKKGLVCRIVVHEGVGSGGRLAPSPGNNTISTINNNDTINTIKTK